MGVFLLKRLFQSVPVLAGVTLVSFFVLRLIPGDPVQNMLGERGGSPELLRELRETYGLNKPLWTQYFLFLKSLFQGDLGKSLVTGQSVAKEFWIYFPATLELSFFALTGALFLGVPLGIISALKRNTALDYTIMGVSLLGFSMSVFWWGLMLILVFSVTLGWTPVAGRIEVLYEIPKVTGFYLIDAWFSENSLRAFGSALHHLLLPGLTLGAIPLAFIVRMTRAGFLEVLKKDYIRTARAKGLDSRRVFFRHAFLSALIPVITVAGFLTGALLTGAVLTETIFSWPGIGHWLVKGTLSRDYPVITGGVFLMAFIIVAVNISVDVIYAKADPSVRDQLLKGKRK